jgi:hypothetical protein
LEIVKELTPPEKKEKTIDLTVVDDPRNREITEIRKNLKEKSTLLLKLKQKIYMAVT